MLLSFGTTLAASPEIRSDVADSLLSSQQTVQSIDNTYIVGKDLASYTPRVEIRAVTEDVDTYYVDYLLRTIDLKDSVWQDVEKEETLKVGKDALEGGSLGFYVTRELKQRVDREMALLVEVQGIERKEVTQKTVAVTYSGLIGTFIDDRTEVVPEYVPPPADSAGGVASQEEPHTGIQATGGAGAPQLQVLGNNPARLSFGEVYADLGVLVTDDSGADLGYKTLLDGVEVSQIKIPTTSDATYVITYKATDGAGHVGTATRTVIVGSGTTVEASTTPAQ